ncbi:mitotic-spindle organizing protein associated with a ring of gamma-tubulin 1-like [Tropilaelaps mercedesae]|uniref:Mitotic-spindle organizing protein associated with a ring of gamma-tubulin 1-like n=1 Tax=Tropilaelaps mercedesae TaxID=418985 RepID=A0A1V9XPH5_9ACAR|nr:mitotic-spindle organizing protein associated with a ring of gamma-tubulin 1-like [Tropilaelaps mercedesae]
MSQLLNTTLDSRSLHLCIRLLEHGADPRALAEVVRNLQARFNYAQHIRVFVDLINPFFV